MLLDFFMPARCAGCGAPGGELCPRCEARIATSQAIVVGARGSTPPLVALGMYEGCLRTALLSLKFRGARGMGMRLGRWIAGRLFWPFDLIVPVPLHAARLRERGYNQAAEIAKGIASASDRACVEDAIERVRATAPQSGLEARERLVNVADAFAAGRRRNVVADRRVLIVDDVVTTGATVRASSAALVSAGARLTYVACAALRL